jgi:hypothetical protein
MKSIILNEDRLIDGIPRVKGEVVIVANSFPSDLIKKTINSDISVKNKRRVNIFEEKNRINNNPLLVLSKERLLFNINSTSESLILTNAGRDLLLIESISVIGRDKENFSVTYNDQPINELELNAKQKIQITIIFNILQSIKKILKLNFKFKVIL